MAKAVAETFSHDLFMATFNKSYPGGLVDLSAKPAMGAPGTFLPTPSEALNLALGIGGFPMGRVVEIYGPEASGKSTLAGSACAAGQKYFPDKLVGYIDAENAVNKEYFESLGMKMSGEHLAFTQVNETEQALNMVNDMAKSGSFSVIVVDSVNALISASEFEEQDVTKSKFGGNSKAMSSSLRFIQKYADASKTLVIFLNQIRDKFVMFGSPETTSGGQALRFYASVRLRTAIVGQVGLDKDNPTGAEVQCIIKKNKCAPPLKKAKYHITYGVGIDQMTDLIEVATEYDILTKAGSWYKYSGENVGQGLAKTAEWLFGQPNIQQAIRDTIWSKQ